MNSTQQLFFSKQRVLINAGKIDLPKNIRNKNKKKEKQFLILDLVSATCQLIGLLLPSSLVNVVFYRIISFPNDRAERKS